MKDQNPILLFDGECKVCNFWVQFIQRRKSNKEFQFLPFSTNEAEQLRTTYSIDPSIDSVIYIVDNKAYVKSNAALQIIKQFGVFWRLLLIFWLVPKPIRDWGYDLVAKNRHKFFGTKNECDIH